MYDRRTTLDRCWLKDDPDYSSQINPDTGSSSNMFMAVQREIYVQIGSNSCVPIGGEMDDCSCTTCLNNLDLITRTQPDTSAPVASGAYQELYGYQLSINTNLISIHVGQTAESC
jgi:hypothetical protein